MDVDGAGEAHHAEAVQPGIKSGFERGPVEHDAVAQVDGVPPRADQIRRHPLGGDAEGTSHVPDVRDRLGRGGEVGKQDRVYPGPSRAAADAGQEFHRFGHQGGEQRPTLGPGDGAGRQIEAPRQPVGGIGFGGERHPLAMLGGQQSRKKSSLGR